ncbi:MAG: hypothetical protein K0Q81_1250 [Paenibacillus sp.]|jgi:hypothetical protein|nr:hypothetical protein [Paenibacillus sp.]
MIQFFRRMGTVFLISCVIVLGGGYAHAETEKDLGQAGLLLEKGLSLYELDREIMKLQEKEGEVSQQIKSAELSLVEINQRIQDQSKRVKQLLQASYTGDRVPLWSMVLSAKTWKDALYVFEQMQIVTERDRATLERYVQVFREKTELNDRLEQSRKDFQTIRSRYEDQRRQMLALQDEVARKLASLPDKDSVTQQMLELNKSWETKGRPLFKQYFAELARTMQKLPDLIAATPNALTMKGFTYTFQIRDSELNAFIHAQSSALQQLNFSFEDGIITAIGKQGELTLKIKGVYELELKPKNAIRFHLSEITYNGIKLPESTAQSFAKEHDLSFYPSKIASFLQASELKVKDRILTVTLKLGL